jgi:hypothetical protein
MTELTPVERETPGLVCPKCKNPLRLTIAAESIGACIDCGSRIEIDNRYRDAIAQATATDSRVEHAAWKETVRSNFLAILLLFLFFVPGLRHGFRKLFPNQFVSSPIFLAGSSGLILVEPYAEPMFLPWSCIVGWSFQTASEQMNALMEIHYSAAGGQTATVTLQGDEFGEIFDVLRAKFPDVDVRENLYLRL